MSNKIQRGSPLDVNITLAKSIGWSGREMRYANGVLYILTLDEYQITRVKVFDYRDPMIIWPIAVKYRFFPRVSTLRPGSWVFTAVIDYYTDTPELAVAMSVIRRARK